jgi:hypothetical protein
MKQHFNVNGLFMFRQISISTNYFYWSGDLAALFSKLNKLSSIDILHKLSLRPRENSIHLYGSLLRRGFSWLWFIRLVLRYISLHFTWRILEHERTKASAEQRVFMVKLKGSLIHLIQVFLTCAMMWATAPMMWATAPWCWRRPHDVGPFSTKESH